MAQQIIDTTTIQPNGKPGDPLNTMANKINANDTELYQIANAALPKSGGSITGALNVSGAVNMYNTFNVTGAATFGNGTRINGAPQSQFAGTCVGWNTILGSGEANLVNNLAGGTGGWLFQTVSGTNGSTENARFFIGAGGAWGANTNNRFAPQTDASQSLGGASNRWTAVYAVNGTIQTSDENAKTGITDSALGLNFVLSLRPVSYRMKVARNEVTTVPNPNARSETVILGYEHDADGVPILDEAGQPIPITQEIHYDTTMDVVTPVAGTREHQGLIAQEVFAALHLAGVDPAKCGIWTIDDPSDPTSGQGLRYEELIGPIIGAIKQLHDLVQAQAATIAALTAQVAALGQPASGSADSAGQGGTAS